MLSKHNLETIKYGIIIFYELHYSKKYILTTLLIINTKLLNYKFFIIIYRFLCLSKVFFEI